MELLKELKSLGWSQELLDAVEATSKIVKSSAIDSPFGFHNINNFQVTSSTEYKMPDLAIRSNDVKLFPIK